MQNQFEYKMKDDWLKDVHTQILCTGNQGLEVRIYNNWP